MPQRTKNGHAVEAVKEELLAKIAESNERMEARLTHVDDRVDKMYSVANSMAQSYVKLEKDLNNHLHHMGWGQVGQVAVELLGFLGVLYAIMSRGH